MLILAKEYIDEQGGEGAGYAGGILSAGIDGIKVAEAVASSYQARQ